jgi:hypothetical protein
MERLEDKARTFAVVAHGMQQYDGEPYVEHLDDVAWFSRPFGENAAALAYLHDVAEDTMYGVKEVRRTFGADMARWVGLLTDPEAPNRKARKEAANARLAAVGEADFVVLIVKAADRLANVARCRRKRDNRLFEMYRKEHEAFEKAVRRTGVNDQLFERLKVAFERPLHAVYVDPLCEVCIFNNVGNPDDENKCSCIWTHDDMKKLRAAAAAAEVYVANKELQTKRIKTLEQELEAARLWKSDSDRPLPEDSEIEAAFPTRSGHHDLYWEAMRLVGARYSKGGLVALVTWLLLRITTAEADVARRVAKAMREHFPLNTSACGWANWIDSGAWREKPGPCLGCDRNTVASCPLHDAPDETKKE